jgi:hypothetical protein
LVASAEYATGIDDWNYFAAGKAWSAAWLVKNVGMTVSPELIATYAAKMTKRTVGDIELSFAPEMPMEAIAPVAYAGPTLFAALTGTQPASSFKLIGGMG